MNTTDEKKIEKLENELLEMARERAVKEVDEVVADIAARKILDEYIKYVVTMRALDYALLYGIPNKFKDRTEAARYIIGEEFEAWLINHPEEVKDKFTNWVKYIYVKLSSMTEKEEENEN